MKKDGGAKGGEKNMNFLKNLFNTKKMKYGTNATILTVVFIAILVVLNLIVGTLDLKLDLTKEKLFSLDQQTLDVLKSLDKEISIYALYAKGNEPLEFKEILDRYSNNSKFINIELIDPIKNPTFAKQFDKEGQGLSQGSIIFANEDNSLYKIVSTYDLFNYNYETGRADSLKAEQAFTNAIVYVSGGELPKVYFTEGHEEIDLMSVRNVLEKENYITDSIDLFISDIGEDVDLLVISSPNRDFDSTEIEKLDDYFDKGGRAIFLFDPNKANLSNLENYLQEWGLAINKDIVIEGDTDKFYQMPTFIFPELQSHTILSSLTSKNLKLLIPQATSLNILFEENRGIKLTSLLKSSTNSWGKVNFESQNIQEEEGDFSGPLDIAVAITRPNYGDTTKETKIIVTGNSQFLRDQVLNMQGIANLDFFLNSLNWTQDTEDKISIRPKSMRPEMLTMTYKQVIINAILVVIIIPLIIFVMGGVVWFRRRHL